MINKILSRPVTLLMCVAAVVVVGIISLSELPIELMPSGSEGEISIIYEVRGGVPPNDIENFVVRPVEDAVGDIDNLKDILSISKEGRAIIVLEFVADTDMDAAAVNVRERLAQVRDELPSEVERPIIAKYQQDDVPIFVLGVTSPTKTAEEIREVVDDVMEERIARLEGVANVDVFGGRERKIIIEVIPSQMSAFNLSMSDVINALNRANVSTLAGEARERESEYQIKATGRFKDIEDISGMGVSTTEAGSIVRLKDIAEIKDSYLEPDSLSRLDMKSNVTIYIQKETLARTVDVAELVLNEKEVLRGILPEDIIISTIKNDAEYIQSALNAMQLSLVLGAVLAAAVLMVFLKNYVLTFIIFLSIPVSVLLALSILYFNNVTLNVMTMGGLALGVGMLLDNSIVVIENIYRTYSKERSLTSAVCEGVSEVFLPIMAGTLTTVIVFLPIIFISAELRRMQGDMALAIMYSLLASLFASLTLVPFLYKNFKVTPTRRESSRFGMYEVFRYLIEKVLKHKHLIVAGMVVLFVVSIFVFNTIDMNLFETEEENEFTIHVELPTGAKLDSSDEVVGMVENILSGVPEVESISTRIEKWSSKVFVTLEDYRQRDRSKEEIKEYLRPQFEEIPYFIYFQEAHEMAEQEVFVELYGYEYDTLRELVNEVGNRMGAIDGLTDTKIRMREGRPEKLVIPDRRKTAIAGLRIADVAENLHARLRGLVATRYHEAAQEIEVIVRQYKPSISNFNQLFRTRLMNPSRAYIQLNQIAEFKETKGPSEIWRKNRQRMVQASSSRSGISLEGAVREINRNLAGLEFPEGYFYEIGGDYEFMMESRRELFMALLLTIVLVYLVLGSVFESYTQPFIIMVAVPMSFIGVVAALKITGSNVSVGVIMGVILLAGIVVNNSIILVDRINSLRKQLTLREAVITGASQRLRPILMTTITTVLGLLPLALMGGEGSGMWRPLSVSVVGGLITSTFLVLFGIPCIFLFAANIRSDLRKAGDSVKRFIKESIS